MPALRRQPLLNFQDVPGSLRLDWTNNRAGVAIEHGLVELGQQLASSDFMSRRLFSWSVLAMWFRQR
jgi:hypothetical protein